MSWLLNSPLQQLVELALPAGIVAAAGPIGDFRADLSEVEQAIVQPASQRRQRDFAAGRHYAHIALSRLVGPHGALVRDSQGRPTWPAGVCGSVSHTSSVPPTAKAVRSGNVPRPKDVVSHPREVAVAVVAHTNRYQSIGVDIEQVSRITDRLIKKILTPDEVAQAQAERVEYAGLVFSAKEAGYKAINPIVGEYVGFQEAQIDVSWTDLSFTIRYLGSNPANRLLNSGRGVFAFCAGYVFSLFVIK